jgi:hypothetical protein
MKFIHDDEGWDDSSGRMRVLLECPPSATPSIIADLIERNGYQVRTCTGPNDRHACDLLEHGACELVDGADAVVNMLNVRTEPGRSVAEVVLSQRRPPKVIVEVAQADLAVDGLELAGASVLAMPVTSKRLINAIDSAFIQPSPMSSWCDGQP